MSYAHRMASSSLCLFIGLAGLYAHSINKELQTTERTKTMNQTEQKSANWLAHIKEQPAHKSGSLITHDAFGNPILLEWEKIDAQSLRLTEKIKSVSEMLAEIYTKMELEFARQYPEAIPNELFLKSLEPLFKDGIERVNWEIAQEQLKAFFQKFFTTTDFAQFSGADDIHIFVTAKDQKTGESLGLIQFLITSDYAFGTVKVAFFGVIPTAQARGLEKLLVSVIFKLITDTKRIFLHTRSTNITAINTYQSWGFTEFPGQIPNWTDLEIYGSTV